MPTIPESLPCSVTFLTSFKVKHILSVPGLANQGSSSLCQDTSWSFTHSIITRITPVRITLVLILLPQPNRPSTDQLPDYQTQGPRLRKPRPFFYYRRGTQPFSSLLALTTHQAMSRDSPGKQTLCSCRVSTQRPPCSCPPPQTPNPNGRGASSASLRAPTRD